MGEREQQRQQRGDGRTLRDAESGDQRRVRVPSRREVRKVFDRLERRGGSRRGEPGEESDPSADESPRASVNIQQVLVLAARLRHPRGQLGVTERAEERERRPRYPNAQRGDAVAGRGSDVGRHGEDARADHAGYDESRRAPYVKRAPQLGARFDRLLWLTRPSIGSLVELLGCHSFSPRRTPARRRFQIPPDRCVISSTLSFLWRRPLAGGATKRTKSAAFFNVVIR